MMNMNYWFSPFGNLVKKSYKKQLARYQNNMEVQIQFNNVLQVVLDEFEWKGLPETCSPEMIEKYLTFRATAGIYYDKQSDTFMSLGAGIGGKLNVNGHPDVLNMYGMNGFNVQGKAYWPEMENEEEADCVLIQDNRTYFPLIFAIEANANRIAKAKRNLDVAATNSKFPFILQCNEEQKKSILDIYTDMQENQPLILLNKGTDMTEDNTTTFTTNLREGVLKELWDYYINCKADTFRELGVNMNQNNDKKERMTITEVEGDTDFVSRINELRLQCRKEACERMNKLWGLNVSVELKHQEKLENYAENFEENEQEGGMNDDENI